jgi:hypothetical protein
MFIYYCGISWIRYYNFYDSQLEAVHILAQMRPSDSIWIVPGTMED